jgi:hypothetical protein
MPAGSGDRQAIVTWPMGTVMAGAPVGGATCGELLPAPRSKRVLGKVEIDLGFLARNPCARLHQRVI